jgi:hypothetical protein
MADQSNERSPRFSIWAAFLIFSVITLGSVVEVVHDNRHNADYNRSKSAENWAIACSAITFSFTAIVVLMHLHSVTSLLIVGTKFEGGLIFILVGFWIAAVSVITDSRKGLSVDSEGNVSNGNLYYFSWAGFCCSVVLLVSFLRHVFNVDIAGEIRLRSARLTTWSGFLAASLVVMGSSANFYDNTCGGDEDDFKTQCGRAVYGIVLGALSTLFAVMIVGLKIATSKAPFLVEALLCMVVSVMYAVGVALLTSEAGPGHGLGNIYYFTWLGFVASFMLLASCFEDYNAARSMSVDEPHENNIVDNEGGIPVASIEERI